MEKCLTPVRNTFLDVDEPSVISFPNGTDQFAEYLGRTKEDIVEPDRFRPKSGPPAEGTVFSEYRETADEDDYDEDDENFSLTRPFHSSGG